LIVDVGSDETIELGETIDIEALSSQITVIYQWEMLDTSNCMDCAVLTLTPDFTALYRVQITDTLTQCTATDEVLITVEKPRKVYIPNAFSPNADGQNDVFGLSIGQDVERILSVELFNRWGGKVFSQRNIATDVYFGWDGNLSGQKAEAGVYIYRVEVLFKDGVREVYGGDVTLMR